MSGRRQGDLRKHLQLQPQQAGCCSPDNNGLMRQAPAKPSPDNLCAASCPSSTQAPTHQPWPWDFQGRRATQNTKGSQIPRSRAGQAELLTYQGELHRAGGARFAQHTSTGLFPSQILLLPLPTNSSSCLPCLTYVIIKRKPFPSRAGRQPGPTCRHISSFCPTLSKQVLLCELRR